MRTIDDCLDDIQDDSYAYTTTLLEFIDADVAEGLIKAICQAVQSGNAASLPFFAQSLGQVVNDAMFDRAVKESKRTLNPLHDSFGDVEKALDALTIRG